MTNAATGAGACFRVDQVLGGGVDQAGVFRAAAADVVDGVLRGVNGTVLAYGQTGAGKTYTMSGGGARRFEDRGVCARALAHVFAAVQREAGAAFTVRVSYLEVYNEHLVDLLADSGGPGGGPHAAAGASFGHTNSSSGGDREELAIQENRRGQTFIRGLTRPVVASEEQALELLFRGDTNRSIAEHCLNAASTRSHCILTVYVERRRGSAAAFPGEDDEDEGSKDEGHEVVYSKLNLVDLAGSERMKKTLTAGSTLREALHINKSLSFLEQVVLALGDKKRQHVPFRQSTLTNLLKDSLGGNCRTVLVACVWPAPAHADQTAATLRFATRMMRVKTRPVVNVAALRSGGGGGGRLASDERAGLQAEIRQLRAELAMVDALHGLAAGRSYDAGAAERLERESREQVRAFVRDASRPPPVESLRQVAALLAAFRAVCVEGVQPQGPGPGEERAEQEDKAATRGGSAAALLPAAAPQRSASKLVTQLRALRGHTPPPQPVKLPLISRAAAGNQAEDAGQPAAEPLGRRAAEPEEPAEGEKALFERFRASAPTPAAVRDVDAAKQNLRAARGECAALSADVNRAKLYVA